MVGSVERLLEDNQTGWIAGNWHISTLSIAICLDNDFEGLTQTTEVLKAVANHIKHYYPLVSPDRINGHREANPKTVCPVNSFLTEWKDPLIRLI